MTKKARPLRCYSYIRFSTPKQKLGDSERRQMEATKRWAKRRNLVLDETLVDDGRSGFKGTHRTKGHLGRFLARVERGDVPRGSYLIIENADRLSREGAVRTIREVIGKLWDRGITIVTLSPEEEYPPDCDNEPKFIAFVLYLQRAYDESRRKQLRVGEAWKSKRQKARDAGTLMTNRVPAWLKRDEAKGTLVEAAPGAFATIRRIFELRLMGVSTGPKRGTRIGKAVITRILNDDSKSWRRGKWATSYIEKILRSPAVYGAFQPCTRQEISVEVERTDGERTEKVSETRERKIPEGDLILDYYPAVIDKATFDAVQQSFKRKGQRGRPVLKEGNALRGLVVCGYCQGAMHFKGDPRGDHLICANYRNHARLNDQLLCGGNRRPGRTTVECPNIRYREVESTVVSALGSLAPAQVLQSPEEIDQRARIEQARLSSVRDETRKLKKAIDEIEELLGSPIGNEERLRLLKTIGVNEGKLRQLEKERQAAEEALSRAQESRNKFIETQAEFVTVQQMLEKRPKDTELRRKLRSLLATLVERVECFSYGFKTKAEKQVEVPHKMPVRKRGASVKRWVAVDSKLMSEGEDLALRLKADPSIPAKHKDPVWLEWLTQRRMSRHGRFLRVHFPSGNVIELVPAESLATVGDDVWNKTLDSAYRLWVRRYGPHRNSKAALAESEAE